MPGYLSGRIRSDRILLEWDAYTANDFMGYKIIRNGVAIKTILEATANSFVDSGLVQNTFYNYKIGIYNRNGMARVDTIRLKTPMFQPPSDFDYRMVDSTTITLYWKNNAESATKFRVYRKFSNEPDTAYILVGIPSDTVFTDRAVENGRAYYYRVEAFNDWESTRASFPYYVFVNYRMNAPDLYSAQQIGGSRSVRLLWRDNSNAEDGFRIYRRKSGDVSFNMIATVPMNTTEYVDTDSLTALQYGSTYEYAVTAYNASEETPFSNIRSVTIVEQNYVEIGTGDIDWSYPFHTFFHDARTQILYLASEIGQAMTIRRIAFYVVNLPGQTMNNFVVRMKHTTISSYSSSSFDNSGYTLCFNNALTVTDTGWVEIELTTPFHHNGTSNLIIDISFNNSSYTRNGNCKATDTGVFRSITFRSDSGSGDDPLNYTAGELRTYIPNIRLFTN